jgi:curved DNA-binding protein
MNNPYSDFFSTIFGGVRGQATQTRTRPRRGQDIDAEVDVTLEEAYHGTSRILQMDGRRIEARIPPGVRTGSRIRLSGQGEPGRNGGSPGDLYLVVRVLPNERFERDGDDLYTDISVDVYTAALGGEVRVPTLDREVLLSIPARTQAGRSFRLKGKGMSKLNDPKNHGDLFARVRLVLPEHLTDRELELFRELVAERQKVKE